MNKHLRESVKLKFNGVCAFCGYNLGKGWTVWDIDPIKTVVSNEGNLYKINEHLSNLMPACKSCGSTRSYNSRGERTMNIEEFRQSIIRGFEFIKGGISGAAYGKSVRYGLIKETGKKVVFHFETVDITKNN